jgi:hypothetical protein
VIAARGRGTGELTVTGIHRGNKDEGSGALRVCRLLVTGRTRTGLQLVGSRTWDVNVSSPATFGLGPGQYLPGPAARTTMYGRCLRSAAVSARAVRGMERRRVGRSTAETVTHTGCRSPNSREGSSWQLVLTTQTEERASQAAFNTSGRGGLWKSLRVA